MSLINDFKTFWGGAVAVATAGPLGLWAADLTPPWPESTKAVTAGATLFCAAAVAIAVSFPMGARRLRVAGTIAVILGLVLCVGYMKIYSDRVVSKTQVVQGKPLVRRWVTGSELRPASAGHGDTAEELLMWGNFDPANVWTPASLSSARMEVLITFFVAFSLLTAGFSLLSKARARDSTEL